LELSRYFLAAHSKKIRDICAPDLIDGLMDYTRYHFARGEKKCCMVRAIPSFMHIEPPTIQIIGQLKELCREYKRGLLDKKMDQ